MNGKAARALRNRFGTGAEYKKAKRAFRTMPTSFAQRTKSVAGGGSSKPREPSAPTWPRTEDQKAQSRPLIVVGPRRQTSPIQLWKMAKKMSATVARQAYGMIPKHMLDRVALQHPVEIAV